jgi:hypothetical protein
MNPGNGENAPTFDRPISTENRPIDTAGMEAAVTPKEKSSSAMGVPTVMGFPFTVTGVTFHSSRR